MPAVAAMSRSHAPAAVQRRVRLRNEGVMELLPPVPQMVLTGLVNARLHCVATPFEGTTTDDPSSSHSFCKLDKALAVEQLDTVFGCQIAGSLGVAAGGCIYESVRLVLHLSHSDEQLYLLGCDPLGLCVLLTLNRHTLTRAVATGNVDAEVARTSPDRDR